MQLELDEDIEIGSIPLIDFNGNTHEMRVALICYKDRRYVAISRAHRGSKDKTTGKEKIIHRNSIWIPISQIKRVTKLLILASQKVQEYLPPIPKELEGIPEDIAQEIMEMVAAKNAEKTQYAEIEDDYLEHRSISVREDARLFLEESVEYLKNSVGLTINTKDVFDRMKFTGVHMTGVRVVRAIDYLEDAGYIKAVENFNGNTKENIKILERHNFPELFKNSINTIDDFVYKKALQISGLSKEDVDSMDYFEDGDPRIALWLHAKKFAEFDVMNSIKGSNFPYIFKITSAGYNWLEDE